MLMRKNFFKKIKIKGHFTFNKKSFEDEEVVKRGSPDLKAVLVSRSLKIYYMKDTKIN